jgi:LmbE family N-acetylglucosaminyl deacetylase
MRYSCLVVLLSLCVGFGGGANAADDGLLGVWILTEEVRGRDREFTVTITADGATWKGDRELAELSDLQVNADSVSFNRAVVRPGLEASVKYTGKLVDGDLVGTADWPRGERTFTAKRMPESVRVAIEARSKAIAALDTCDILAVFAHPDDETFATGTFAKLSANGKRIQLVYTTSGDAGGDKTGQGLKDEALAKTREDEMRAAARVIKTSTEPLFLRYPDGFVYENWDDVLENVLSVIEQTKPDILVTFGPDGYYGHQDHLAIGQITERAFDESGTASILLHAAIPRSINDRIKKLGGGSQYKAVDDKYITYLVDVKRMTQVRVAAMEAHATQFDGNTIQQYRALASLTGIEGFVEVRNTGEAGTLADMFSEGDRARRKKK